MNRFQELRGTTFDVIVIGAGIIGAGIARDAALRGLKVALFEKSDFGSGTTAGSTADCVIWKCSTFDWCVWIYGKEKLCFA